MLNYSITNLLKMKRLPDIEVLREMLTYCPESGELRWLMSTSPRVMVGDMAGCVNPQGYCYVRVSGSNYATHRIAWALHYGEDPELYIDHKNGDRSDNRIANLRLATSSENGLNRRLQSNNTSGHRGVCRQGDKWRAKIKLNGKVVSLGIYNCKEEAITARLQAEADNNIYVCAR